MVGIQMIMLFERLRLRRLKETERMKVEKKLRKVGKDGKNDKNPLTTRSKQYNQHPKIRL